ncbi:unnamed protein product [Polarella glacialis]|uniref:Uncharacterized protein n=1 Tax=Polarella glacialis TaxID=89957 RepID=A0A813M094_POLGL|nr:unnamed protein product [Polarella glacialis]
MTLGALTNPPVIHKLAALSGAPSSPDNLVINVWKRFKVGMDLHRTSAFAAFCGHRLREMSRQTPRWARISACADIFLKLSAGREVPVKISGGHNQVYERKLLAERCRTRWIQGFSDWHTALLPAPMTAVANAVGYFSQLIKSKELGNEARAAFDVIPSNEASTVAAAPAGTWWRTWGPIFATYTYEDVANSRTTVYMRRNLLRMGSSHTIARCDGQGPKVTFTEGSNFLANRVRKVMGMNQGMTFKIFMDDKLVAVAEETSHGFESLTFREEDSGRSESSSVLKERHFHGLYDLWLVKNDEKSILPNYVASATTLLLAFHTINHDATSKGAASNESPNFLEKPPPTLAAGQVLDEQQESSSSVTGQATAVAQAAEQAFASVAQKAADGASAEIREELPDRRQQPEEKKADQEVGAVVTEQAVDVAP